jgi:group I intron endonuclease
MNKNKYNKLDSINWLYLNEKGYILPNDNKLSLSILEKKAGVYIYQYTLDKNIIYIGSTGNIAVRINQHRRSANKGKICSDFYICVREHGWSNLRLGILEYINVDELKMDEREIKRAIFDREQYYLDMMNTTLNKLKIAGSSLGYKHTKETRRIMSLKRRGKNINRSKKDSVVCSIIKNNLSLFYKNGIKVKVFDDNNNIVNIFPTIASAAKHYALSSLH